MSTEAADFESRARAFYDLKILAIAYEWDVVTELSRGAMSARDLAAKLEVAERPVTALLMGLGAMGLVRYEQDADRWEPTEKGSRFMVTGSPNNMRDVVRFAEWQFDALPRLREAVKDRTIVWNAGAHYLKGKQATGEQDKRDVFDGALDVSAIAIGKSVMTVFDFANVKRVMDVGGNLGGVLGTIMEKFPGVHGTVFDLPHVVETTKRVIEKRGFSERMTAVAGDMNSDTWPTGYDVILTTRVLTTRDPHEIVHVGKKALEALPSGGRFVIFEEHLSGDEAHPVPPEAVWGYVFMLILSDRGGSYSRDEWTSMLREAGFAKTEVIAKNKWAVVIGTKA